MMSKKISCPLLSILILFLYVSAKLPDVKAGYSTKVTVMERCSKNARNPDGSRDTLKKWEVRFAGFGFYSYTKNGHTLPYRLHSPQNRAKNVKYPLVLFFHGAGERGNDNRMQFMRFPTTPFWDRYPCFVLAPQCPARPADGLDGESVWVQTSFGADRHTMKAVPSWPMALSIELLEKIIRENPIDPDRIYVTGLSMGGFATWEILQRHGEWFAAGLPVCGGADLAYAPSLARIPLWVFHGDADTTVPVGRSRDIVSAIIKKSGKPVYSELPSIGHGAWTVTYNDPKVWDWLFAQHR